MQICAQATKITKKWPFNEPNRREYEHLFMEKLRGFECGEKKVKCATNLIYHLQFPLYGNTKQFYLHYITSSPSTRQ
jgi:hypothetical protein